MKNLVRQFTIVFFLALAVTSCKKEVDANRTGTTDPNDAPVNMAMGNPSGAVADPGNVSNYLITKKQYSLSYHRDRGIPNWVSWHLDQSWLGTAPRQDDFRADDELPTGWYRVQGTDYSGSGFDRGHNTPSADRTASEADNSATFLMTNMIPQAPNNNQQTWNNLESYCRTLVNQGNELYIIMGNYGTGGTGSNGTFTTIVNGKVTVPNRIWKVVLVLPQGTDDVNRVTVSTRVIAVNTPNSNNVNSSWGVYRTTVDDIEAVTGYDLFSNVAPAVQSVIEAKVDSGPTN
jgi:endonuclease G